MKTILCILTGDRGCETLEGIVVAAMIVALAAVVYPGTLAATLTGALGTIGATILVLTG